jgi:hypothetical protein
MHTGWEMWWHCWVRHCALSQKDVGSNPNWINEIWLKPSGQPMALGSTQPLTEMSTRDTSCEGGKQPDSHYLGLTTMPPSWPVHLANLGTLNSWSPKGLSRESLMHTGLPCHRSHNMSGLIISDFSMERPPKCLGCFQSKIQFMVTKWHLLFATALIKQRTVSHIISCTPIFQRHR